MLTIKKDKLELIVTVGAYENIYARMGYKIVLPKTTNNTKENVVESLEITKQKKTTKK